MKANKTPAPQTFTSTQTKEAIKKCKPSKALGPEKISNLHLKHLGPLALDYLTEIFNHCDQSDPDHLEIQLYHPPAQTGQGSRRLILLPPSLPPLPWDQGVGEADPPNPR